MSTYVYLECLDHDPPLASDGEVGQHLYDLPRIRSEIANRDVFVAIAKADLQPDFDHFTSAASRFSPAIRTAASASSTNTASNTQMSKRGQSDERRRITSLRVQHPKHAHDHRADHQRPSGKYGRRCMAFDSYGCPCECPGYDPVPDEDDIGDGDCVTDSEMDELDDICRGRLPVNHHRRLTASPDVSGDADA